jgi:hypothetical protein
MDQILLSRGLPPPLLEDMDLDITSSQKNWRAQVSQGIDRSLTVMEQCLHVEGWNSGSELTLDPKPGCRQAP